MTKAEILEAISAEWTREYGQLHEADEDQKDKYYFMIGFVASAMDNAEDQTPEAWIIEKPLDRRVIDAYKHNPLNPEFWIHKEIPEGCSVTPLYSGERITKIPTKQR